MKRILLAIAVLMPCAGFAQEKIDEAMDMAIRREATNHSQVMHTLHMLSDRYGPRLTGSPQHEAAAKWAAKQMTDWGMQNAHLEGWDWGHPGWANESAWGRISSPVWESLGLRVSAWTPSTKGTVSGSAVQIIPPRTPSESEMKAWVDENKSKVRGKMVLVGLGAVTFPAIGPATNNAARGGGGGRAGAPTVEPGHLTAAQVDSRINQMLLDAGALVRIHDGAGTNGMIRESHNRGYSATNAIPGVTLLDEDYGRITRLLADGEDVKMEFNIVSHFYPEGKTSYNVIAEIPGTSKADEVVMLGGHLDSWHVATGATDNGIGSAMMMEAARIIQSMGVKPLRTIRVGLWSGEEEGLLGSKAYVEQHFGTFENPKSEFKTLVAYFNVDSGGGSVRTARVFGPQSAADILQAALKPFADLGVEGAATSNARAPGQTDSGSFAVGGLTAVSMGQYPSDYGTTHHTSFDNYEHVAPEEVIKCSEEIAAAVWHVANRPDRLPAYGKDDMPAPPASTR